MKTLVVHAHPEPSSLNGSLRDVAVTTLESAGHAVQVSDLYAMNWKAAVDAADFGPAASNPLSVARDSGRAYGHGDLSADIVAEQDKLLWADTIILQFPLWWYGMPAILKGWVDRVFTFGFAYGVGEHSDVKYGERFGEGTLAGRRALLSVTTGGPASHYATRGISGPIDDLLFPIQHGILYYPGMDVLPPFVIHGADRMDDETCATAIAAWRERLQTVESTEPIAFRPQNFGDYEIPSLHLKPGLEPSGRTGFGLHVRA